MRGESPHIKNNQYCIQKGESERSSKSKLKLIPNRIMNKVVILKEVKLILGSTH